MDGLPARAKAVFEPHTELWSPADLIGRSPDITRCDHCGRAFLPADDGYTAYWVVPMEELRLLEEVQREQTPEGHAALGTTPPGARGRTPLSSPTGTGTACRT